MQAIIGTELRKLHPVAEQVPSELEHLLKLLKDLEVLKHSQGPPERSGVKSHGGEAEPRRERRQC
jgi:hypothetical protein